MIRISIRNRTTNLLRRRVVYNYWRWQFFVHHVQSRSYRGFKIYKKNSSGLITGLAKTLFTGITGTYLGSSTVYNNTLYVATTLTVQFHNNLVYAFDVYDVRFVFGRPMYNTPSSVTFDKYGFMWVSYYSPFIHILYITGNKLGSLSVPNVGILPNLSMPKKIAISNDDQVYILNGAWLNLYSVERNFSNYNNFPTKLSYQNRFCFYDNCSVSLNTLRMFWRNFRLLFISMLNFCFADAVVIDKWNQVVVAGDDYVFILLPDGTQNTLALSVGKKQWIDMWIDSITGYAYLIAYDDSNIYVVKY